MSDDHRQVPIEDALGVRGERPLRQDTRRLAGRDSVDAERHGARRPLREVVRLQPDQHPRRAHERLPVDRQLRPLLRPRNVHAHTTRRVAVGVTVLRLVADPDARADVVEIAGG